MVWPIFIFSWPHNQEVNMVNMAYVPFKQLFDRTGATFRLSIWFYYKSMPIQLLQLTCQSDIVN